jgi:hypothetical protein
MVTVRLHIRRFRNKALLSFEVRVAHPIPDAVSTLDFPAETVTRG